MKTWGNRIGFGNEGLHDQSGAKESDDVITVVAYMFGSKSLIIEKFIYEWCVREICQDRAIPSDD